MKTLRTIWQGDIPLGRLWWFYNVLVTRILLGYGGGIVVGLICLSTRSVGPFYVFSALLMSWWFVLVVGVWRSAKKYQGPRIWPLLARCGVVLGVVMTLKDMVDPTDMRELTKELTRESP